MTVVGWSLTLLLVRGATSALPWMPLAPLSVRQVVDRMSHHEIDLAPLADDCLADLVDQLLAVLPEQRPTAAEALQHPFFRPRVTPV